MNDYVPLLEALEGHFEQSLDELPDALRERVVRDIPQPWNSLSPVERRHWASAYDYMHSPATKQLLRSLLDEYGITEPAHLTLQDALQRKATLLQEITEVISNVALPDDIRNAQLADLRSKHHDLGNQLARGDFLESDQKERARRSTKLPGHLNHDQTMQVRANQIANEQMTLKKRSITKGGVANILAKELGINAATVERRLRKEWKWPPVA